MANYLSYIKEKMSDKRTRLFILVCLVVLAADHTSKWLITTFMKLNHSIYIINDFFALSYIHNTGIAFGLLDQKKSPLKAPVLVILSLLALGFIFYIFISLPRNSKLSGVSTGLIFGGALGNIIDRILRGKVVDFLDFDFPDIYLPSLNIHMSRWPTFNIADSCVLAGIIILVVLVIAHGEKTGKQQNE